MFKKIKVVFSSHGTDEENQNFIKDINESIGTPVDIFCYPNFNQYSLTEVYNKALKEHNDDQESIFVFLHNDIIFNTPNWGRRLLNKFNSSKYGIIGLAGTKILSENAVWWHVQSEMIGIVNHTNGLRTWESKYSNEFVGIKPVILIDGVFMAVNPQRIVHNFDENYKKYHFYDLSFCISNYLDNVDIGVITDIRITHKSIGMVNEDWEKNRSQFVEEYKHELPITYLE